MNYKKRVQKLRQWLKSEGLPGLLVTDVHNVTYLTGFSGDSSYLLVTGAKALLLTDSRYNTQVEEQCPGLEYETRTSSVSMVQLLGRVIKRFKLKSLGIEGAGMTKSVYDRFESALSSVELVTTSGVVERFREIKDRDELAEIRLSIQMAQRTFESIRASLRGEMTEHQVAADLEHQIRCFGGVGCAFSPIVGVGPRAALPHGIPSERRIEEDPFVLIDWGAQAGLYMSDLTRVLVTGKISAKFRKIYEVVLRAQLAAIAAIRPGVLSSEVDGAARRVIEEAGYGKRFGHGLGHGFGLQIHEEPRMSSANETPLEAGMVLTVEPGIYLPGFGGVRIEDDILVTADGHEVLTSVPKDLESMRVDL